MQRIAARFYPSSLLIPSPPRLFSFISSILTLLFCYVARLWPWRRWTVAVLVTRRSLVHMLVVSKCPLAEIWTSPVWLVVLVKAELKIWEVPWHSTIIVAHFSSIKLSLLTFLALAVLHRSSELPSKLWETRSAMSLHRYPKGRVWWS